MKVNSLTIIIFLAGIYQGICWGAAIPIAPVVPIKESLVVQPPRSENIVFPLRPAKIIIYSDDADIADKLHGYLADEVIRNILANALNVVLDRGIGFINYKEQLADELRLGGSECIIFAIGREATQNVQTRLHKLSAPGLINSVILFDATIPSSRMMYGSQLTPNYEYISNRIYNFYSNTSKGLWRKIYPARNETMPTRLGDHYYFKGINILTRVLNENGDKAPFNFADIDKDSFSKLIDVIAATNKYRLQPDLEAIIKNYTLDSIRKTAVYALRKSQNNLPLLYIHKKLVFNDSAKPPTIGAEVINVKGGKYVRYNASYESHIPYGAIEYFRNTLINEEELSSYAQQILSMKEAKVEEQLLDFDMVFTNPFSHEKMGDEAIDKVETAITTYRLEHDYIEKRKSFVIENLTNLCHRPAGYINVAIVASGGGSRAMFATYGVLKGLQNIGVLDVTSYICGLSGSTWAISSLFTQVYNKDQSIKEGLQNASGNSALTAHQFGFITEAILKAPTREITKYPTTIKVKSLYCQPITNTDHYGCAIAQHLLGETKIYDKDYNPNYLSQQLGKDACWSVKNCHPNSYTSELPFPIYTAVMPLRNTESKYYPWFEFTPYQIGAVLGRGDNQTGMFVKTWAFGREFAYGISKDFAPEQPLEFYLGIFGSAMNSSLRETVTMLPSPLKKAAHGIAYAASWVPGSGYVNPDYRWRFAEVLNPMYLMENQKFENYNKNRNLALIDAGIAFNLPFPPLNDYKGKRQDRKPDVIIFIDASADVEDVNSVNEYGQRIKQAWPDGSALMAVADYARLNEVAFPELPPKYTLPASTCTIINKQYMPGRQEPVVIYIPVAKNNAELTDSNRIQQVNRDNTVNGIKPVNLADINLGSYPTSRTGIDLQDAVSLMALMQYNVLFNAQRISEAICNRVPPAAAAR